MAGLFQPLPLEFKSHRGSLGQRLCVALARACAEDGRADEAARRREFILCPHVSTQRQSINQ